VDRAVDGSDGTFAEAFLQPILAADGRFRQGASRKRLRSADDWLLLRRETICSYTQERRARAPVLSMVC